MTAHTRTLLTVICEAALEKKLLADLENLGAPGWTLSDARGRGSRGVRSAGWDTEGNIRLEVIGSRELAERITTPETLRDLSVSLNNIGATRQAQGD